MNETASPTVLRFFTSSSGMDTPNFSSAATTTSTMDRESTSRSSTKDLSSWTSSTGIPATSLTISARSARISSVVAMLWSLLSVVTIGGLRWSSPGCRGGLRNGDDLGGIRQAGTERDQQRGVPAARLSLVNHPVEGQGDGGRRGVALLGDVTGDLHPVGKLHGAGHRVDDPHVGLVGHEDVEVVDGQARPLERLLTDLGHGERRPAEDRVAEHGQVRHLRPPGGDHVAPVLLLPDQVVLLAVGAPHHRADARGVAGTD